MRLTRIGDELEDFEIKERVIHCTIQTLAFVREAMKCCNLLLLGGVKSKKINSKKE